jgi:DNA-binding transcriptional ArsR family regulator
VSPGSFAYEGLDRVLHEKARLGIVTALAGSSEGRLFTELKDLCALTDGNLNRHLKVLTDAGIVSIRKRLGRGRAETVARLSAAGRRAFATYLEELEQVLRDARPRCGEAGVRRPAPG